MKPTLASAQITLWGRIKAVILPNGSLSLHFLLPQKLRIAVSDLVSNPGPPRNATTPLPTDAQMAIAGKPAGHSGTGNGVGRLVETDLGVG